MNEARRRRETRRRLWTAALSALGHALVIAVVVRAQPEPPQPLEFAPIAVALIPPAPKPPPPKPEPEREPEKPAPPKKTEKPKAETPKVVKAKAEKPKAEKKVEPTQVVARPAKAAPTIDSLLAAAESTTGDPGPPVEVSDSELAGAATAGSGQGGGGCNMPRLLQAALRKDRQVQRALAEAHRGRALRVWNGDWVRHPGQEGAGLARVRESIMWEVGFAPEACRKERVRGLVLISLNDTPGGARIVLGSGDWRWSDLLYAKRR